MERSRTNVETIVVDGVANALGVTCKKNCLGGDNGGRNNLGHVAKILGLGNQVAIFFGRGIVKYFG